MSETTIAPNNRVVVYQGKPTREKPRTMPWSGPSFAKRHNHSLSKGEAASAAKQASAIVAKGGDEGIAIAVANKRINRLRKQGKISDRQHGKRLADKYGGKDDHGIDAASR